MHINAVGQCDSTLETVSVYAEPDLETPLKKAVVFYKSKEDGSWPYLDTNVFLRSKLFTLIDFSRFGSLEKKSN
uniref:Uncharacterized protein n=1 Tax=Caenorhabditis japonica TaxID=281687 RepID=A0A8R1HIX9_CAEJA